MSIPSFKVIGFLTIAIATTSHATLEKAAKPNVLFIVSDDLTATALGSYGNEITRTPHIDQLANQGIRFDRAYSQFPRCGPSRASFMFGYYPHAVNRYDYPIGRNHLGRDKASLSQHFRNNGYYTARVSKIFHMGVPIDIVRGSNGADDRASWTERFNSQGPEVFCEGESELLENNPTGEKAVKGGNTLEYNMAEGDDLIHSDGKTAAKAVELIHAHKDEPFFIAVGFVRPHVPFVAPEKYFEPYDLDNITLPEKVTGDWDDLPKAGILARTTPGMKLSLEQEKKAIAAYYASVSFMDAQVGKVLQALEDAELEDNTIVIFISDHGFHLGEHNFWMKVGLMEESVRVPMIIKLPGQEPSTSTSLVELVDLYPTLAELCGLDVPSHLQGKSLAPVIKDPNHSVREAAFCVSHRDAYLIRTERWAYIQHGKDASEGMQLYDMSTDPKQFNNLANNPEYATVIENHQRKLTHKLKEVSDNDLIR